MTPIVGTEFVFRRCKYVYTDPRGSLKKIQFRLIKGALAGHPVLEYLSIRNEGFPFNLG